VINRKVFLIVVMNDSMFAQYAAIELRFMLSITLHVENVIPQELCRQISSDSSLQKCSDMGNDSKY